MATVDIKRLKCTFSGPSCICNSY